MSTEIAKCGICGSEGSLRDYSCVNSTHHWGTLPCGHRWERHLYSSNGMVVVTCYDELSGDFSIDSAHHLPRYQVRTNDELDRFLTAFKADRNIKAAIAEAYAAKGFPGFWELIELLLPGYWDKVGRMRARLLLLAIALLPVKIAQALRYKLSLALPCGTVEWDELQHYALI